MRARLATAAIVLAFALVPAERGARGDEVSRSVLPATGADAPSTEVKFHVDDDEPGVLELTRGEQVRLVLLGAGEREMHLHGYDVVVQGRRGEPAVFEFDAAHSGRFPITAHGADTLLGGDEKALLYLEVRDP